MTPRIHVACDCDNHRRRTRTALALTVVALTLPLLAAALLGLVTLTDGDSKSIMVVRYACMACQTGSGCSADSYFTTYQQAASHYANSARCNQSPRGIATVVLPSRPTDVEAGPVAQALQRRHGLAYRDAAALGVCSGSGSALEVISCPYIKKTND